MEGVGCGERVAGATEELFSVLLSLLVNEGNLYQSSYILWTEYLYPSKEIIR